MKVIIAGSRNITDYNLVVKAVKESGFTITEVVCGLAKGPDTLGEQYAIEHNIPIAYFPADWNGKGRAAGPLRNEQMGNYADALIAVWNGKSRGTKHMIYYSKKKGLMVYVKNINEENVILDDFYE